jgi:hypothetical protein
MTSPSFHESPLFDEDDMAELQRIARAERERERLRVEGERLAERTRREQGKPRQVEVLPWTES